MTAGIIRTEVEGGLTSIVIDRADCGNQLTLTMIRDLAATIREAGAGPSKTILLRSTGANFCLGRDTRGQTAPQRPTSAAAIRDGVIDPILDVYRAISTAPIPLVCSVQGAAEGFGCALATACDITLAAEDAVFSLPELEKDFPPTLAISAMMSRVGRKGLAYLVYSTQKIDAETAAQMGLVSRVVRKQDLAEESLRLASNLCARSRNTLVGVKDYFRAGAGLHESAAAELARNLLATALSSRG